MCKSLTTEEGIEHYSEAVKESNLKLNRIVDPIETRLRRPDATFSATEINQLLDAFFENNFLSRELSFYRGEHSGKQTVETDPLADKELAMTGVM